MENKELTVKQLEVNDIIAPKINCNFEEVNKDLDLVLERYDGLLIGEYDIKPAKKIRADLNKLKTSINDKKKEVKKLVNKEYVLFEDETKKMMSRVDGVIAGIDEQLDEYEIARRKEKEEFVCDLISSIKNCDADIPFKDEWLNSSYSNKKIKEEVESWYEETKKNLEAIELLQSDYEAELKEMIACGVPMADVLAKKTLLEMAHERSLAIEEAKKQEIVEEQIADVPVEKESVSTEKEVEFVLKFTCSLEKADKLKQFIKNENIFTERLK